MCYLVISKFLIFLFFEFLQSLGRLSLGGTGRHRPAVLLQRSGPPSPSGQEATSDLISTATTALRRLHFKSAGAYRTKGKTATTSCGVPKVVIMGSSSVSIESAGNTNNTSTDSSNTVITMVTVTDGGDTEDSLDYSGPISYPPGEKEETIRITSNLLEDMLDRTPGSSLDR